jgi:hypothetical protein
VVHTKEAKMVNGIDNIAETMLMDLYLNQINN